MTVDFPVIKKVAEEWGIGTPDLFASATLMRPVKFRSKDDPQAAKLMEDFEKMDQYERSVRMKERLKGFLTDTDKMPKEILFIGRNLRYVSNPKQRETPLNLSTILIDQNRSRCASARALMITR